MKVKSIIEFLSSFGIIKFNQVIPAEQTRSFGGPPMLIFVQNLGASHDAGLYIATMIEVTAVKPVEGISINNSSNSHIQMKIEDGELKVISNRTVGGQTVRMWLIKM